MKLFGITFRKICAIILSMNILFIVPAFVFERISLAITLPHNDIGLYLSKSHLVFQCAPRMGLTEVYQFNLDYPSKSWCKRHVKFFFNDPNPGLDNLDELAQVQFFKESNYNNKLNSYGISKISAVIVIAIITILIIILYRLFIMIYQHIMCKSLDKNARDY